MEHHYGTLTHYAKHSLKPGWGKPTRTLVSWRQGFRHPTRSECMSWSAQILKPQSIQAAKVCTKVV